MSSTFVLQSAGSAGDSERKKLTSRQWSGGRVWASVASGNAGYAEAEVICRGGREARGRNSGEEDCGTVLLSSTAG